MTGFFLVIGRSKFPPECSDIIVAVKLMIEEYVLDLKLTHTWISHLRTG